MCNFFYKNLQAKKLRNHQKCCNLNNHQKVEKSNLQSLKKQFQHKYMSARIICLIYILYEKISLSG